MNIYCADKKKKSTMADDKEVNNNYHLGIHSTWDKNLINFSNICWN